MLKKSLFYLLLIASVSSCKNDDVEVFMNPKQDNSFSELIADAATKFKNDIDGNETRACQFDYRVKTIRKMQKEESETRSINETREVYSVAFDQNMGSVIIANVNETYIPLAYFPEEQDLDINECLSDSLSEIGTLIGYLADVAINYDFDENEAEMTRASNDENEIIVERMVPKCKVNWHQGYPYNKYCYVKGGKQAAAGCVAIAGAQALTVLRPNEPLITSWDAIVEKCPSAAAIDEIAKLVHFIGASVGMKYGEESSSAKTEDLGKFLRNQYGLADYDAVKAIDVLKTEHGIVIIKGYRAVHGWGPWKHNVDGHAFIGDGYVKYNKKKDPYYLHLNYGWGAAYNKDVYVLSTGKNWKAQEGRDAYGTIFTHGLKFFSLTYPSEKNW